MKKPGITFPVFLLATSASIIAAASENSHPNSAGWNPTRQAHLVAFPADQLNGNAESVESPDLFPADVVRKLRNGPSVIPAGQSPLGRVSPSIQHTQALHVFPSRLTGRPRIRHVSQPSSLPPAPSIDRQPPSVLKNPMGMTEERNSKSGGMPEVTNVDQVFEGEAYAGESVDHDPYYKWCKGHLWLRSSGDMPQHMPYAPVHHGYYYYQPYNYNHVIEHQQRAPLLGAESIAPYETGMFEKVYTDVLGDEAKRKRPIPTLKSPDVNQLPTLEDLLDQPADESASPEKKAP